MPDSIKDELAAARSSAVTTPYSDPDRVNAAKSIAEANSENIAKRYQQQRNVAAAPAAGSTSTSVSQSGTISMPAYADPDRVNAINQMYDANINAQKASLQTSYDQNMSNMEANRESIAKRYEQQRNAAATDYERQRRNFNEQAMTNGLATGVGSQASLAQNSAYQKQQGQINAAEGTDTSNLERSIADLKVKYQNDINAAVADNDYKRAAAMLDEYNNAYSMAMQKAQNLAQYGDFSGYADIYGADAARQMSEAWAVQNPLVAYSLGNISAAKYYQLTGSFPPGYSYSSSSGGGGGSSRGSGNNTYSLDEINAMVQRAANEGATSREIRDALSAAGMSERQINNAGITYTQPGSTVTWPNGRQTSTHARNITLTPARIS